jgi:hypothetical protein
VVPGQVANITENLVIVTQQWCLLGFELQDEQVPSRCNDHDIGPTPRFTGKLILSGKEAVSQKWLNRNSSRERRHTEPMGLLPDLDLSSAKLEIGETERMMPQEGRNPLVL